MLLLPLLLAAAEAGSAGTVTFGELSKVGEMWAGGTWGKLDAHGVQIPGTCGDKGSPPCHRGTPGAQVMDCPSSSAALLAFSSTHVAAAANDTVFYSSDGGRSWEWGPGPDIYDAYIPSPQWLGGGGFMDIRPVDAYVPSCTVPGSSCHAQPSPVIAKPNRKYLDWHLSPTTGMPAPNNTIRQGANTWSGFPHPVSFFCTECGGSGRGGTQLPDGSYVFLVALQYTDPRASACCNNSVASFVSDDGLSWTYTAAVTTYDPRRLYQEGTSESSLVLLQDNKTLWAVIRTDSCDGEPSHRTLPYLTSQSTDRGRSWSTPTPLPDDMLSATPMAAVLGNGALLVSGGRPGVDLWLSADGFGQGWQRYSLPTYHNQLVQAEQRPADWAYCEPFVQVAANHSFAGDPVPKLDTRADGAPLFGWMQSSGRVAVTALEPDVALVCYDRQGWGAGYYGVGLPPIFGPLGQWPYGRSAPPGCWMDHSVVHCMRVTVTL